ncbi:glycosyltransferase family 2 protein [Perlabentimonas gracilis]|uniref:glycosyltransferase family 2 protein n=1 Tax=Perlabentimonas gracilis TaxID=2715279 RepID=UPI00140813D9|nr:hypothetical protein [Perlabentimonas gracilis]NHB69850.1 hypothetical protein [Perlabentimonas gracilis]
MLKKKVAIICVNYNSYSELNKYIASIDEAINYCVDIDVEVFVGDNSTDKSYIYRVDNAVQLPVNIFPYHENLGYIGAVTRVIKDIGYPSVKGYDYVIISNVDLTLTKSFFKDLSGLNESPDTGWIAPKIFSLSENRDRNPKILIRPSLKRINLLIQMYRFPLLYNLYNKYIYKHRNKSISNHSSNYIYAGHGSFMIFTKKFMGVNVNFEFPSFLFGEEIFFAEIVRSSNLKVLYAPNIIVNDSDHISTSKLKRKIYCKMNYESLKKLKNLFFNE